MNDTLITLQSICAPCADILTQECDGELLILPPVAATSGAEGRIYTLDATGYAIWDKLDGVRTLDQVVGDLAQEFDAPRAEIEDDLLGLLNELARRGMVVQK